MSGPYTADEIRAACVRKHYDGLGVDVPLRWQGKGPIPYRTWKTLIENSRYEIDRQGQVRVREGNRNAGHVLRRFRKNGSLCVEVWRGTKHTTLRLWMLMEKYFPKLTYPRDWKPAERKREEIEKDDGRVKLTEEQRQEIIDSNLSPTQLARLGKYPVGRRHISRIRNGA